MGNSDNSGDFHMGIEIENVSDDDSTEATYIFDIEREMASGHTCAGIIRALAEVTDSSPNEMPPLHTVVNCDAIEALFRTGRYGETRDNVSLTFHYDVFEVSVDASGKVVVKE